MATEKAVEQVAEQVAEQLEEAAEVTRQIDTRAVSFFLAGTFFGVALGFYFGYKYNREKIKAEAIKSAEEEIDKIREVYQQKLIAAEPKPSVDEMIAERGYSVKVQEEELPPRPTRPPVPVNEPEEVERKLTYRTTLSEKDKNDAWSFPKEMAQRTADRPYIIHQDEFAKNESEYSQTTYVYYVEDDVLVDTDDSVIEDRVSLIGENMLTRFGHGADDYNILYIRNPVLEVEIEICRDPGSYEETVLGLERNGPEETQDN